MVKLEVKRPGSTRRCILDVDSRIEVLALRSLVAKEIRAHEDELKLVFRGKPLQFDNQSASFVNVLDGDVMLAVVAPKAPPLHVQNMHNEDEEEDDLTFRLPEQATPLQRRFIKFLKERLKVPDFLLVVMYSIRLRTWLFVLAWFVLARLANYWQLGPIYVIVSILCLIFFNLGRRREGELSAYSIFNEGFRELPGTLNADRIDRDLRAGQY